MARQLTAGHAAGDGGGLHAAVLAAGLGFGVRGLVASPLPGPAGNVEYLLWLTQPLDPGEPGPHLTDAVLETEIARQVTGR